MPELDLADFDIECRSADGDRYISGIVMPWDVEINYRGHKESFRRGAFDAQFADDIPYVPLWFEHWRLGDPDAHPLPIGSLVESRSEDAGQWAEFMIDDDDFAVKIWKKCKSKSLRRFSSEFKNLTPGATRGGPARGRGRVTKAFLAGTAVTTKPVYTDAEIMEARARMRPKLDEWKEYVATLNLQGDDDETARAQAEEAQGSV